MKSGGDVFQRTVAIGFVVAVGALAPVSAQQPTPSTEQQQVRAQMQIFESVLQGAVRNGGTAFVRDHADFIPHDIQLTSSEPQVIGLTPPQSGTVMFLVQVPLVRSLILTDLMIQRGPRGGARSTGPLQQTANEGRTQAVPQARAQGLPDADPMLVSPVVDGFCAARVKPTRGYNDPNYEYFVAVCDALVDAMLEHSGQLGVKENEWLTIAAVSESDRPSVVSSAKKIYLSIKGADLTAYRQGRLPKDDARRRVELKLD
jgi:hypothetical protein